MYMHKRLRQHIFDILVGPVQGTFDVGDSEDPSGQSRNPRKTCGEFSDSQRRAGLNLCQCVPGNIQDICHPFTGFGNSYQKVCEQW